MKFHYNDEVVFVEGFYKGTEARVLSCCPNGKLYDVEIEKYKTIKDVPEHYLALKDTEEEELACQCIIDKYETLYQIISWQVKDKFQLDELLALERELTLLEEQGE